MHTLPTSSRWAGLWSSARPRQWLKNLLVFAAPGAAGVLGHRTALLHSLAAFAVFCVTASGTYMLNDSLDRAADRLHPRKRLRPVAAGVVPVRLAVGVGAALLGVGLVTSYFLGGASLFAVMAVYVAINLAYSVWLRKEPVIDMAAVASGFVLRAIAGGVAAGVTLSNWFLIVASFGSLMMVAGRRYAEHVHLGDDRHHHRATLGVYTIAFLRYVLAVASIVTITAYCLWAFDKASTSGSGAIWFQLSIIPFVIAILRYALLVESGDAGAPEDIVLGHRVLQILGVAWIGLFAAGVYGH